MCRSLVALSRLVTRFAVLGAIYRSCLQCIVSLVEKAQYMSQTLAEGHSMSLSDCSRCGEGNRGKGHPINRASKIGPKSSIPHNISR